MRGLANVLPLFMRMKRGGGVRVLNVLGWKSWESKTVVNWVCGEWQIHNKQYVRLVGVLQHTLSMLSGWGLTSPASGQNLYKHFFRE
eukprot:6556349-Pyramimonas_sp.AAC.1